MNIKHLNNNRFTRITQSIYGLPEHSLEPFQISLTKLIKASGINQKELAKALRISNTTIFNYCEGLRTNPTKEFMQDIADFFDIKPSYFLEYRILQLQKRIEKNPELVDVFLDLATSPNRLIAEYNRIQKSQKELEMQLNDNN